MEGEASAWRNLRSKFKDKIARKDDRRRVRGKRRVNSLNELLLYRQGNTGGGWGWVGFRTYRDLSYKDFLITFHPFPLVISYCKKSPSSVTLWAVPRGAARGCAALCPGGSGGTLAMRACANGLMSKWKVYFQ